MTDPGKPHAEDDSGISVSDVALVVAILGSVQAFSSYSLFTLMLLVGVPKEFAWVLPVSTDAVVILATKVWLNTRYGSGVRNYAMGLAVGAFVISIVAAGIQHTDLAGLKDAAAGIKATNLKAPEWLKFAIGAIPTTAAGFVLHLVAMMSSNLAKARITAAAERAEQARRAQEKARKDAERKPAATPSPDTAPKPASAAVKESASNLRELPAPGTPTKKELGIRWVVATMAEGKSADDIRAAHIDSAVDTNGYFKKHMDEVMTEARRRHNDESDRSAVGE